MPNTDKNAVDNDFEQEKRAFYKQEAEHFFTAELYHDQRANWLLALASGLLTLMLGALYAMNEKKLSESGRLTITVAAIAFGLGILAGLFALWPISGRKGQLWNPLRRRRHRSPDQVLALTAHEHFIAHKHRAAIKADRVVFIIVFLSFGLVTAIVGMVLALVH